jgi:hypothetical protein
MFLQQLPQTPRLTLVSVVVLTVFETIQFGRVISEILREFGRSAARETFFRVFLVFNFFLFFFSISPATHLSVTPVSRIDPAHPGGISVFNLGIGPLNYVLLHGRGGGETKRKSFRQLRAIPKVRLGRLRLS